MCAFLNKSNTKRKMLCLLEVRLQQRLKDLGPNHTGLETSESLPANQEAT